MVFLSLCSFFFGPGGKSHEQNEEWRGWKNENQRSTWTLTGANELQQLNDNINFIGNNNASAKGLEISADKRVQYVDNEATN